MGARVFIFYLCLLLCTCSKHICVGNKAELEVAVQMPAHAPRLPHACFQYRKTKMLHKVWGFSVLSMCLRS